MDKKANSWYAERDNLAGRGPNGIEINTDPDADARAALEGPEEAQHGVKTIGGGQHGKIDKGVKRVSRNRPS